VVQQHQILSGRQFGGRPPGGFEARVTPYEKGYQGYRQFIYKPITRDYKLSRPTKVKKVKEAKKS